MSANFHISNIFDYLNYNTCTHTHNHSQRRNKMTFTFCIHCGKYNFEFFRKFDKKSWEIELLSPWAKYIREQWKWSHEIFNSSIGNESNVVKWNVFEVPYSGNTLTQHLDFIEFAYSSHVFTWDIPISTDANEFSEYTARW